MEEIKNPMLDETTEETETTGTIEVPEEAVHEVTAPEGAINAEDPKTSIRYTYLAMGTFNEKRKKTSETIEFDSNDGEDLYYFKMINLNGKGNARIGIIHDEMKRKYLAALFEKYEPEAEKRQLTLNDIIKGKPEPDSIIIQEAVNLYADQAQMNTAKEITCIDAFLDEIHYYANLKYAGSIIKHFKSECCNAPYVVLSSKTKMKCNKCGKGYVNSGLINPPSSIRII